VVTVDAALAFTFFCIIASDVFRSGSRCSVSLQSFSL
jgi:hypothetical protein